LHQNVLAQEATVFHSFRSAFSLCLLHAALNDFITVESQPFLTITDRARNISAVIHPHFVTAVSIPEVAITANTIRVMHQTHNLDIRSS
jgi:hypothetical protein